MKAGQKALVVQAVRARGTGVKQGATEAVYAVPQKGEHMDWPANVHRETAEADGFKPEDFRYHQWPVSNVRCENSDSRHYPFYFRCDMPKDTPLCNQYVEEKDRKPGVQYEDGGTPGWLKVPDPVGLCLQSVDFRLLDANTGEKLAENVSYLTDGAAMSKPKDRQPLWKRLVPYTSIQVKLVAFPDFFFLGKDGGMQGQYANTSDGQFKGAEVESPVYTLTMDHDGNVSVA